MLLVQVQELSRTQATGRKMALVCEKTRAEAVCSLEQTVFVLLNDKSRTKGDLHVRFREKFEVKLLLLTRLRGRRFLSYGWTEMRGFLCLRIIILLKMIHCVNMDIDMKM